MKYKHRMEEEEEEDRAIDTYQDLCAGALAMSKQFDRPRQQEQEQQLQRREKCTDILKQQLKTLTLIDQATTTIPDRPPPTPPRSGASSPVADKLRAQDHPTQARHPQAALSSLGPLKSPCANSPDPKTAAPPPQSADCEQGSSLVSSSAGQQVRPLQGQASCQTPEQARTGSISNNSNCQSSEQAKADNQVGSLGSQSGHPRGLAKYQAPYQHTPVYQAHPSMLLIASPQPQFHYNQQPYLAGPNLQSRRVDWATENGQLLDDYSRQDLGAASFQNFAYFWGYQQSMMRSQQINHHLYQAPQQLYLPTPICAPAYTFAWPHPAYQPTALGYLEWPAYPPSLTSQLYLTPTPSSASITQLKYYSSLANQLLSSLPIRAQAAKTRQAYGMDKVWKDEFEQLFSQIAPNVFWNLVELESNPVIVEAPCIIAYRGHYLVDPSTTAFYEHQHSEDVLSELDLGATGAEQDVSSSCESQSEHENSSVDSIRPVPSNYLVCSNENEVDESDCDSGSHNAPALASGADSGLCSDTNSHDADTKSSSSSSIGSSAIGDDVSSMVKVTLSDVTGSNESEIDRTDLGITSKADLPAEIEDNQVSIQPRIPTKFRMFIDSAKVRFCCENCGHGWTSMKGRVVFWYELFEFVNQPALITSGPPANQVIGYCAYKLFGQQCDICKIENRFEQPMWYPEEVTKVLNNLHSKIGQVYFGFKMPAIDKQRRAGKPKTSHNSSLCQACQDGLCTDVARYTTSVR